MQKTTLILFVALISGCAASTSIHTASKPPVNDSSHFSAGSLPRSSAIGMVVTANPYASKAGAEILKAGGSAVDAAIAIEAVLSLVEPQSSGLGGGGFMVHFNNQSNNLTVYDGREEAPSNVTTDLFLNEQGEPMGFFDAKNSGLSIGVPGMVSMLAIAHTEQGKLPWGVHFDRAKQLAVEGFAVSPRLADLLQRFGQHIPKTTEQGPLDAYRYFFDNNGKPLQEGTIRTNPAYAKTLEIIAKDPADFYRGDIARQILAQARQYPRASSLTMADITTYKAQKHNALCARYREYQLCGPPPASSWVTVAATLGLLEYAPAFSKQGAKDASNWSIFAEAQRLAYADRDYYIADNRFVEVPIDGLLSREYLKQRAALISASQAKKKVKPGDPWAFQTGDKAANGQDATMDIAGTTHFVVIDAEGDVVSMTASVESILGSTRMAGGMFLNNQLTDFSFKPVDDQGKPIANRVQPAKRPRSSMSPTIVLDKDGEFLMATGSPGGSSIIAYTLKTLVGVLDWKLSPQEAVNVPTMVARGDEVRIEKGRAPSELIDGLRSYGYTVKESAGENSGLSVIVRKANGRLEGGVDPRREGTVEVVTFDQ